MTEFYIIRHGQTAANAAGLKQGTIDDHRTHLSATGKEQAMRLAKYFNPGKLTNLYVSPLHRTRQTAAIINDQLHLPVTVDQRLLEISYGDWDGQQNDELMAKYPDLFYPLIKDVRPDYATTAHGETFAQVEQRVRSFTEDVVSSHPDERVVVVTHGFTVRSFAANAVDTHGLEILEPTNCSVSKIVVDPHTLDQHLVYYNRVVDNQF
jgi:probable phosphoglycerate mutase